jgi:acetylornithine/succinyldiaminopimelate/putrescine aminotransferase
VQAARSYFSATLATEPAMAHLMNTYARLPVAFTHGRGAWLIDEAGNEYLDALAGVAGVKAVRGQGLMIGIELDRPCGDLVRQALAARLLINVTQDSVIRLLPPLVLSEREADAIVARLAPLVRAFCNAPAA